MIYAKVNEQNEIIEFPYRLGSTIMRIQNQTKIPQDAVPVNTEANKPVITWDKTLFYDGVENVNGEFLAKYRVEERYDNQEEKVEELKKLAKKAEKRNEIWFRRKAEKIKSTYPFSERESWAVQREEALAYSKDSTVPTPLLSVIAENRGITLAEMVSKVLQNVDYYNQVYGRALGVYQRNKDLLAAVKLDDESTWVYFEQVSFPQE